MDASLLKDSANTLMAGLVLECLRAGKHPFEGADSLGEILRSWAFKESYGCYSCFDLIEGFERRPVTTGIATWILGHGLDPNDSDDLEVITRGFYAVHPNGIEVAWHWDGDGTLVFRLPDGTVVANDDCKKDYGWEFM